MAYWTDQLPNFQPFPPLSEDNIDCYHYTLSGRRCILRRQTFPTQTAAEQQGLKEKLVFGHSHRNIVESLEVTVEKCEDKWHVYVLAPYMKSLEEDWQSRDRDYKPYTELELKGYLLELVAALAYLQLKVGFQIGNFPPQYLPQSALFQHYW